MKAKKGEEFIHRESDGSSTLCKLTEPVEFPNTYVRVKWLEPWWSLTENVLINRKGTFSTVNVRDLEKPLH